MALDLLVCLLPGLSVFSHIGGGVTGFLLGILFSRKKEWHYIRLQTCFALLIFTSGLVYTTYQTKRVEPLEKNVDKQVIETFKEYGYMDYAETLKKAYNKQYKLQ